MFYAHSGSNDDFSDWQPLQEHLQKVANLADMFARDAQPIFLSDAKDIRKSKDLLYNTAWYSGLFHDLGKYREEFQQYLKKERSSSAETAHAVYGAAASCFSMDNVAGAFAIAGHHAGLHDMSDLQSLLSGSRFKAEERYLELIRLAEDEEELGTFPEFKSMFFDDTETGKRRYEFMTRMLLSILVDADRLDTERWKKERKLGKPWQRFVIPLEPETLLQQLEAERDKKAKDRPDDDLNKLRNNIFDACLKEGRHLARGFFSLTVPTGGGKTLSSMVFALSHARRHGLRRVIVVIPYLSIIEQNADEYRKVFGSQQVIEHHSAVELPNRKDADDPAEASDWEKATENWDAPIIVTTSVQFIETLFAASPSKARKLHNIARSVVIFDEVQTLPTHLLEPTLDILRELKDSYGVSFLFCSATQPAFKKSANLKQGFVPDEMKEIAPDPERTYQLLRRVDYHIKTKDNPWDWKTLAEQMVAQPQALCVINLRRQAFKLWQAMRDFLKEQGHGDDVEQGLFHLSSAMCPAHRLDLLGLSKHPPPNNIKVRLNADKPCWVVSTQLIEAGVDIDFPVVFRAMGPLDSIVQAAGRCNREGQLRDGAGNLRYGKVIVFSPEDAGLPHGIYERATNIATSYLDPERLVTAPDIFAHYFNELYQISPTDHSKRGEHSIQHDRAEFNFRRVADHAKVIKENTIAVIVPYRCAKDVVRQIRDTGQFDRGTLRKLQRYMVNVRSGICSDFTKLQQIGALEPLLPEHLDIQVLDKSCYKTDLPLGVVIENRPLEDFIQ
ncbi:MAG: hypothetical protein DDT26_00052 [Dehalococcoidia bacterium]|nr:hypothetical protein [Chloroflexota bacterium]